MKVVKKFSLAFLIAFGLFPYESSAQTYSENINVSEPGTLRELINDLPGARLESLTISGSLNGKDIAYLVGGTGKMVSIDTLDISKVTLVGDDEPYKKLLVKTDDVGFGKTTEIYYLSERDTIIYEGQETGLGGYNLTCHVYCKDLSGAFAENSSFKHILMPENLTKVGNYQFFQNTSVCTVDLPQKASKFGERAFDGASALINLRIPDGIITIPERSVRCESLEKVELPSSVDSIFNQAFQGSPIKNIDLKNVKYVGNSAFSGNKLTGILDIGSLGYMGSYAFNGSNEIECILFSSKLKEIPDYAFSGAGIESLELPSSIESIGAGAFSGCENLTDVILSPNLVNLSSDSFLNTPWQNSLKGDNGVIYAGPVALCYNSSTAPKDGTFSFREGTTAIANGGFFPTFQDDWYLEKVYLPESLIRIGNFVFGNCKDLKEINIPDGLLEIGSQAFGGCESLQSITLPDGLTEISNGTFRNCKELQEIVFPKNINRIGESAFEDATKLYFSELPSSLKVIENSAFAGCKSIPSVTLPENLDSIYTGAFWGCTGIETIRLKSKNLRYADNIFQKNLSQITNNENNLYQVIISPEVTILPDNMFLGCNTLEKIKFEDINSSLLTTIGKSCFCNCSQLSINELPLSLDSIGDQAFIRTLGYQGVLNTANIRYIGGDAFSETSGITDLIISSPTIFIGYGAFGGCDNLCNVTILSEMIESDRNPFNLSSTYHYCNLKKIEIGSKLKNLPNYFFSNISTIDSLVFQERGITEKAQSLEIGKGAFDNCYLGGLLKLPEGTLTIGEWAFENNNFSEVVIPNSCVELAERAFGGNEMISEISIGDGIENIGDYAFAGCKNIKSLTVPATCKEIGTYFIDGCSALQSIYFLSETPPIFKDNFGRNVDPTIFVPYNSIKQYMSVPELIGYNIEPLPSSIIPAESISLSPNTWSGHMGESFLIEATVFPEDSTDQTITWTSSDESVATVDSYGNVNALTVGDAIITASCGHISAICTVTVLPILVESLTVDPMEWYGEEGSEFSIYTTILPENATDKNIAFESSDTTIATVDNDGHVNVLKEGFCTITVSTTDGSNLKAECNISAFSGIESIFADPDSEVDVYDINGILLKHACTQDQIKHLTPGVYVLRRGNVVVKLVLR